MELLGERPVWSMSGGEMLSALDQVDVVAAQLEAYRLQLVAGVEDIGYAQELGARDTVELLAFRYRMDRPQAHRDVRLARALPRYGAVSTALTDGITPPDSEPADAEPGDTATSDDGLTSDDGVTSDDSPAETGLGALGGVDDAAGGGGDGRGVRLLRPVQAGVIVSALERVRSRVPVADLEVAEEQLVQLAAHLSPGELRKAGKQICDLLDSDGPEPDEQKASARESLTLTNAENGVKFRGYLANENAELLRALIHAGARPHKTVDGELDPRPRDKRQADALSTVLTIAAAATDAGHKLTNPPGTQHNTTPPATAGALGGGSPWLPGFGAKANITVTIDFNDLKAATADATGELVYGDGLSAATIRRLACDAKIIPVVLGSNSEPLDVGRAVRLVTGAMRRGLNVRDRGCVVCGAPPVQCDAHHLVSWIDGGTTAIWNLVLLCRRHHVDLHAGRWRITITNGVVHVTRPTWADPPPVHPGHLAPPETTWQNSSARATTPRIAAPTGETSGPGAPRGETSGPGAPGGETSRPGGPPSDTSRPGAPPGAAARQRAESPDATPSTDASASTGAPAQTSDASGATPATATSREARSRADDAGRPTPASTRRTNPWGDEPDATEDSPSRGNRWANDETLREAARFAVWGVEDGHERTRGDLKTLPDLPIDWPAPPQVGAGDRPSL